METIAFIGLGIMGAPMAKNLSKAGYDVVGYNRGKSALERHVAAGGRAAGSVAEAVSGAGTVITMLPDSPDVQTVAEGPDGIYANAQRGTLHIDCSTIRPDVAARLAAAGRAAGLAVLDAPVSGGEQGAIDGKLSIMAGGEDADFRRAAPVLEAVGTTIVHVGPSGAGQTVKAANQLIVAGTIQLVAEAIVFLEAQGADIEASLRVLSGGLASSAVLDRKAAAMQRREFTPGFRIDLHHKDMGIVIAAARETGAAIPLGTHVAGLIAALHAQGHGGLDHGSLLLLTQQLSGRTTIENGASK